MNFLKSKLAIFTNKNTENNTNNLQQPKKQSEKAATQSKKNIIKQQQVLQQINPLNILLISSQSKRSSQILAFKNLIFNKLKNWDKDREIKLKKHLNIMQEILQSISLKVQSSQQYLHSIQKIMLARLKQLEIIKDNSLNNSVFVLSRYQEMRTFDKSYDLLKELVMYEAMSQDQNNKKYHQLKKLFTEFCRFTVLQRFNSKNSLLSSQKSLNKQNAIKIDNDDGECSIDDGNPHENKLDESSVAELKSNIRYLIDCQLPDIIQQIIGLCQQINKNYSILPVTPTQDLYLLIQKFTTLSYQQVNKHKQISRQLLQLNKDFIEREKKRAEKIKKTLKEWVQEDKNANPLLIRQLDKKNHDHELIEDYYSLEDMLEERSLQSLEKIQQNQSQNQQSVQHYLQSISISPFEYHCVMLIFRCSCFYNKKIQTQLLITFDGFLHLKKPTQQNPEFSFLLNKQITISQLQTFVVEIQKTQKKFLGLKSAEKQFEFSLEFNLQEDIQRFINLISQLDWCHINKSK